MDEHAVNRMISELGGAKALMKEMEEYQESVLRMSKERPTWKRVSPTSGWQWGGRGLLP